MYNPTFDNNLTHYVNLECCVCMVFSTVELHIEHSDLRYDSLMAGDTSGFEDKMNRTY